MAVKIPVIGGRHILCRVSYMAIVFYAERVIWQLYFLQRELWGCYIRCRRSYGAVIFPAERVMGLLYSHAKGVMGL